METVEKLAEQLNGMQDAMISLQKDRNTDDKKTIHKQGMIIMVLAILLAGVSIVFISLMTWTNAEHQRVLFESAKQHEINLKELADANDKRFKEFLSEYEFESVTIEQSMDNTEGDITDSGNINTPPK